MRWSRWHERRSGGVYYSSRGVILPVFIPDHLSWTRPTSRQRRQGAFCPLECASDASEIWSALFDHLELRCVLGPLSSHERPKWMEKPPLVLCDVAGKILHRLYLSQTKIEQHYDVNPLNPFVVRTPRSEARLMRTILLVGFTDSPLSWKKGVQTKPNKRRRFWVVIEWSAVDTRHTTTHTTKRAFIASARANYSALRTVKERKLGGD